MGGSWLAVLLFCAVPVIVPAQVPRGIYNWWDRPVVKDLNLTDLQNRQIRNTVRGYREKLIDQRAAVQKAEAEVADLFNEERFDTHKTAEAIGRLADARAALSRSLTQLALELRSVLTIEQWRELQKRRPGVLRRAPATESDARPLRGRQP